MLRRVVLAVAGLVTPALAAVRLGGAHRRARLGAVRERGERLAGSRPGRDRGARGEARVARPGGLGSRHRRRWSGRRCRACCARWECAASWRRGEPQELARSGELRVIFLNRAAQREHVPVLGATPASFQGERFLWVHVPSVRAAAGVSSLKTWPSLDIHSARRLGIALARVIAHEVVHAVAPGLPHGTGLMSARLDRRMLTAPSITIDPQVGFAVRAALAGAPPAARPADTILAAESTAPSRGALPMSSPAEVPGRVLRPVPSKHPALAAASPRRASRRSRGRRSCARCGRARRSSSRPRCCAARSGR